VASPLSPKCPYLRPPVGQREGIPDFLSGDVDGLNEKYMGFYDRIAPLYKAANVLQAPIIRRQARTMFDLTPVVDGDRVLETSVGQGDWFRHLAVKAPHAEFCGLDLSWGMLKICRRNLRRWGVHAELAHGNAEDLPYVDGYFDVVYHVGGINYFNDKAAAIAEMVRVAKPGARLMIVDESAEHVRKLYQRLPIVRRYYQGADDEAATSAPVDHVPAGMLDVKTELMFANRFYRLTFKKP